MTRSRVVWLALALLLAAPPFLARQLGSLETGHGHPLQVALGPCAFLVSTGLPCPACGLTTSFVHLARCELTAGLRAHPLGGVLFVLCAAGVVLSVFGCVRGWPFARTCAQLRLLPTATFVALALLVVWFLRVVPALLA